MKRYKMLGFALVVVLALSALIASTASAVEFSLAEWLSAGATITSAQASDAEGELELTSSNGGGLGVHVKVLCSGIFDGTVGPGSEDSITKLLTLAGVEVSSTALSGTALTCANDENCTEPLMWAVGLPWKTELKLMVDGTETFFADLITSTAGYYVECLILGVSVSEQCTSSQTAIEMKNETSGTIDSTFSDAFQTLAGLKLANCTLGGSETGEVNGLESTLLTSGSALAASFGGRAVWNSKTRYLKGAIVEWRENSGTCWEAAQITEGDEPPGSSWDKVGC
jgi:hypothetical protein